MKILVISASADSAGIWWRFKREGHHVMVYFTCPDIKESMEGVIQRVSLNEGLAQNPSFIWADMVGNGKLCDQLKKAGWPIFGGSQFCDDIELKREFGIDIAKKCKIQVPETQHFNTVEEAKSYVSKNGKPVCIKCDGNVSAASSHVAKSSQEALEYLEYLQESGQDKGTKFIVQDFVKGVELSNELWMCSGRVLYPLNATCEEKKLMEGNKGPNTGAMSSVVFPYASSSPKVGQETVLKLVPMLEKMKFSGCIDINSIFTPSGPKFLEFTARAGYDALYALASMINGSLAEFFNEVAHGTAKRVPLNHSWGVALRLIIPPAPNEWPDMPEVSKKAYAAIAGQIVKIPDDPYIYPIEELGKDKKGRWVTKGIDGTVAEACGAGSNLSKVWEEAKERWEKIKVPSAMGRFDGIKRVNEDLMKLRQFGYTDVPDPSGGAGKIQPLDLKASPV